jgi:hypothetical protein
VDAPNGGGRPQLAVGSGTMASMKVAEIQQALLLGGVTLPSGRTAGVRLEGARIAAVTPPGRGDLPVERRAVPSYSGSPA